MFSICFRITWLNQHSPNLNIIHASTTQQFSHDYFLCLILKGGFLLIPPTIGLNGEPGLRDIDSFRCVGPTLPDSQQVQFLLYSKAQSDLFAI